MSAVLDSQMPRLPLLAAIGLVGASLLMVGADRLGLIGTEPTPTVRQATATVSHDLRFFDEADGSVRVAVAGGPDRATGRSLNLNAFGPDNRQAFIALIAPSSDVGVAG